MLKDNENKLVNFLLSFPPKKNTKKETDLTGLLIPLSLNLLVQWSGDPLRSDHWSFSSLRPEVWSGSPLQPGSFFFGISTVKFRLDPSFVSLFDALAWSRSEGRIAIIWPLWLDLNSRISKLISVGLRDFSIDFLTAETTSRFNTPWIGSEGWRMRAHVFFLVEAILGIVRWFLLSADGAF